MSSPPPSPPPPPPGSPQPASPDGPLSDHPPSDEEEGEELMDEKTLRTDYKAIPELDRYDTSELDQNEYEEMSPGARARADAELRKRDAEASRRSGRELPAALLTPTDDEKEDGQPRRVRRRIEHEAAMLEEGGEEEGDEPGVNLEEYKGDNMKEFLALTAVRKEVRRRFRQFLQTYRERDVLIYPPRIQAMCQENKQTLEVSYTHLSSSAPTLAVWIADEPESILELLDAEAYATVKAMFPLYHQVHPHIYVRIVAVPLRDSVRNLRQSHLGTLVRVEGVVTRRTSVFPQLKLVSYDCLGCKAVVGPFMQTSEKEKEVRPTKCPECEAEGPFAINSQKTVYQNYQKITLQESPGTVPAGRIPRQKDVILLGDLIDLVSPGEEVDVTGIYKHSWSAALNFSNRFPVFNTVIQGNYLVRKSELFAKVELTDEDIKKILKLSRKPNIGQIIIDSIAPSIYGHKNIKTAIALAMFGGMPKYAGKKQLIRGDINILILGDPGTAKSQFLKYVEKTAHRAVYTTGKGASAVGLTAAVRRDPLTREWGLEGGALVLADNGICLIDEFDKMNDKDRTSIHEAMEQQSISISKAGIITSLKARCSVIAAANPIKGKYDTQATFAENVELTDAILSRFDILCVVKDVIDREADLRLASFVVDSHIKSHPDYDEKAAKTPKTPKTPGPAPSPGGALSPRDREPTTPSQDRDEPPEEKEVLDQDLLRKYILYAKKNCKPKVGDIDEDKIADLYQELRRESSITGGIPIAVRHIESMVRMTEAHAKIHLREQCNEDDVNVAIRVMLDSFIGSQKHAVKTALEKHFSKYITYKKDSFELLLYILNGLVKEATNFRLLRGVGEQKRQEPLEISQDEFHTKARELSLSNWDEFYNSRLFKSNGFRLDKKRKLILKVYEA